jgi:hypothetical protein
MPAPGLVMSAESARGLFHATVLAHAPGQASPDGCATCTRAVVAVHLFLAARCCQIPLEGSESGAGRPAAPQAQRAGTCPSGTALALPVSIHYGCTCDLCGMVWRVLSSNRGPSRKRPIRSWPSEKSSRPAGGQAVSSASPNLVQQCCVFSSEWQLVHGYSLWLFS